jgi:DNA-binding CsgD family transcriptional regulator
VDQAALTDLVFYIRLNQSHLFVESVGLKQVYDGNAMGKNTRFEMFLKRNNMTGRKKLVGHGIPLQNPGMALPSKDWEKINDCLVRLYRELDSEKHTHMLLQIISEFVPADNVALNLFEVNTREYRVISLPEGVASEETVKLVAGLLHESPFPAYYVATGDAQWKMTTDFMTVEDFHATKLYRLALTRLGASQQMCGMLALVEMTAHALTINRSQRGFTEREREILNTLHPHLVTSYINALAFSRSQDSLSKLKAIVDTAPGAYGYFNRDFRMAWMQPKAQEWLMEFFPGEIKNHDNIPRSIQNLLTQSQARGGTPEHLEIKSRVERLTAMLSASPLGGWLLRLERKPLKLSPRFVPLPQFSTRKNEVLQWMVEGKRNAEIARILHLSPRTVEKHVAEILVELHVENRATAIVRAMELCAAANVTKQNG